jgi:hypothetical protein
VSVGRELSEFARPFGRRGHRVNERAPDPAVFQYAKPRSGGSARRRDMATKPGRFVAGIAQHQARSSDRLGYQCCRYRSGQTHQDPAFDHRFRHQKHVRGTRSRHPGYSVEESLFDRFDHSDRPENTGGPRKIVGRSGGTSGNRGCSTANQSRGIGHGPDDANRSIGITFTEGCLHGGRRDPGRNRQDPVDDWRKVSANLSHMIRLNGDKRAPGPQITGLLAHHANPGKHQFQFLASGPERFDHQKMLAGAPFHGQQTGDQRFAHLPAANHDQRVPGFGRLIGGGHVARVYDEGLDPGLNFPFEKPEARGCISRFALPRTNRPTDATGLLG